jgi:biotin carboxyl carrier protein
MKRTYTIDLSGTEIPVMTEDGVFNAAVASVEAHAQVKKIGDHRYIVMLPEGVVTVAIVRTGDRFEVQSEGVRWSASVRDERDTLRAKFQGVGGGGAKIQDIRAPMPALVTKVLVEPGSEIKHGATILVLEAMKMENEVKAPRDGVVEKVLVKPGMTVEKDQVLVSLR